MNLKEFLEEYGMTQATMARRAKVTQSTIFKILNGADVKLTTAMRICEVSKGKITPLDLYNYLLNGNKEINRG